MLNAVKKMNQNHKKILMVEFGEVKFEPAVLRSKTNLKLTTRRLERHSQISSSAMFAGEVGILRRSSEGVSLFGPLVQSFRPRPPRSLTSSAKRRAG
jgi:hypothetical protein